MIYIKNTKNAINVTAAEDNTTTVFAKLSIFSSCSLISKISSVFNFFMVEPIVINNNYSVITGYNNKVKD